MRLKDKVAIVTGSGRGIGRAVALAFAREGADVVISDVDMEPAEQTAEEVRRMGRRSLAVRTDVTKREDVEQLFKTTVDQLGRVDVLVNNAGVIRPAMLDKMTDEQWELVINTHLRGTFYCIREAAKYMIPRRSGKIINVTSSAGLVGTIGQINYSAAKAGIVGVTKSAARELARYNINVNCVAPGLVATRLTEKIRTDEKLREEYLRRVPLGRWVEPEEVAEAFVFLASDGANYITGQVLCVDGGLVM